MQHGRALCAPNATEGQHVAPWWCHVFLHASGRHGNQCLLEELDNGRFDDDEHVFSVKTLVAIFHIVVALTHNECTMGFLPVGKTHKRSIWSDGNYGEFSLLLLLEGGECGAQVRMDISP
jgi:hypothetical protein